jgi:hypothetical protein
VIFTNFTEISIESLVGVSIRIFVEVVRISIEFTGDFGAFVIMVDILGIKVIISWPYRCCFLRDINVVA